MTYKIMMKSGTGGYLNYDGCPLELCRVEGADAIPRIGEEIGYLRYDDNHNLQIRLCKVVDVVHVIDEGIAEVHVFVIPLNE